VGPPTKGNVSLYGDDYLTDPDYKAFARSGGGGGRGATGGGGSFAPLGGGGGGGLSGSLNLTNGGNESALRTLLRSRMRLPSQSGGPSYLLGSQPTTPGLASSLPAGGAVGALLGGANTGSTSRFDTGGYTGTGRMAQSYGRLPDRSPSPTPAPTPTPGAPPAPGSGGGHNYHGAVGGSGHGGGKGSGADHNPAPFDIESIQSILDAFRKAGFFDPTPNAAIMDATRSKAMGDAQALRQRNDLRAQSLGADPATAASYGLQSDLNTQGNVADIMSGTALQQLMGKQNFSEDMLKTYLSGVLGRSGQSSGGSDFGSILAGLGSIIAAF